MNINQGKGYRIFSVFNILLMILICLMIIFPLYYMLIVSISDGAAIAREIADVTIAADSLRELVLLKSIANGLQKRTKSNYRFIMSFNSTLIVLGAMGILPPATSALLHNASTLGVSLKSMTNLLD